MAMVWLLAGLFAGWLALAVYRAWVQARAGRNAAVLDGRKHLRSGGARPVVFLFKDRAGQVEWFVRRIAAGLDRRPDLQIVLVDGGSTDGTMQMLKRLARHFNLGFRRLAEFDSGCRRVAAGSGAANSVAEREMPCWSKHCFERKHRLHYVNLPALCVDLRSVPANELYRYVPF
ncbi:glycosyltransferase family protein [Desulfotruncus alcoholivorax]|uniref:hypothetical protein n=1 Tax=Desulfotruncus alcoholivorax TaxID=265477 RepID=UPI00042567C6|nr:hypothetical protein [Desulfotruncus alcoholivorax]